MPNINTLLIPTAPIVKPAALYTVKNAHLVNWFYWTNTKSSLFSTAYAHNAQSLVSRFSNFVKNVHNSFLFPLPLQIVVIKINIQYNAWTYVQNLLFSIGGVIGYSTYQFVLWLWANGQYGNYTVLMLHNEQHIHVKRQYVQIFSVDSIESTV